MYHAQPEAVKPASDLERANALVVMYREAYYAATPGSPERDAACVAEREAWNKMARLLAAAGNVDFIEYVRGIDAARDVLEARQAGQ